MAVLLLRGPYVRAHVSVILLAALATAAQAQTLDVQPARFLDPRPGTQAKDGEVVLGRTTVMAAMRMFAEELSRDTIRVPRGHSGNSAAASPDTVWQVGSHQVRPRRVLDLGPDHYSLWFDENERLIAAITSEGPLGLSRMTLVDHYKGIRRVRSWASGDQPTFDVWTVPVDACVALSAHVSLVTEQVEQLSYIYTCPTRPLPEADASD